MATKDILTTFEAARLCRVSYNTIKNWIKRDLLSAYRTAGGHLRINASDLAAFCKEHGIPMEGLSLSSRRKVLIVDNEKSVCAAIEEGLSNLPEKFDVYTAADGFEAGSLLQTIRPDMLVLNPVMQGVDGVTVCRVVRKSNALKHTKIVALTDSKGSLDADLCISTPIEQAVLGDAVKALFPPCGGRKPYSRKKGRKGSGKSIQPRAS